jgi:hypothetical protein
MPFLIKIDSNGKEISREVRGRGRPPKGSEKRADGNVYLVIGDVSAGSPKAVVEGRLPDVEGQKMLFDEAGNPTTDAADGTNATDKDIPPVVSIITKSFDASNDYISLISNLSNESIPEKCDLDAMGFKSETQRELFIQNASYRKEWVKNHGVVWKKATEITEV